MTSGAGTLLSYEHSTTTPLYQVAERRHAHTLDRPWQDQQNILVYNDALVRLARSCPPSQQSPETLQSAWSFSKLLLIVHSQGKARDKQVVDGTWTVGSRVGQAPEQAESVITTKCIAHLPEIEPQAPRASQGMREVFDVCSQGNVTFALCIYKTRFAHPQAAGRHRQRVTLWLPRQQSLFNTTA